MEGVTPESMSRFSVIGNVNIDLVVWPAAELPPPGAEVQVETIGMRAAGSAGNSALALAHLGQVPNLAGCGRGSLRTVHPRRACQRRNRRRRDSPARGVHG